MENKDDKDDRGDEDAAVLVPTSKSFASSLKWAFTLQIVQQVVALLISVTLASMLGPRDFGMIAMGLLYISILQLILEQGISAAIIQRKALAQEHLDSAFWITLSCAALLVVISISFSKWWAAMNNVAELATVINWLTLLILVQGFSVVQGAILQREKRFKTMAIRGGVAAIVGGVIGISMACMGYGWRALVAQNLVASVIGVVLLWKMTTWRPRFRFSRKHACELLQFSAGVFSGKIAIAATNKADGILIGLFFGPTTAGLYRLAQRLVDLAFDTLTRPIMAVALPHFSENQDDPNELKNTFLTCVRSGTLLAVPVLFCLAACADLITQVLGPSWHPARYALMLLCGVGILKSFTLFTGSLLMARGKLFRRAAMLWLVGLLNPLAFFMTAMLLRGSEYHVQAAGMAMAAGVVTATVFLPINFWMCQSEIGLRVSELMKVLKTPTIAGLAGAAAAAGTSVILDGHAPAIIAFPIVASLAAGTVASVLYCMDPSLLGRLRAVLMGTPKRVSA